MTTTMMTSSSVMIEPAGSCARPRALVSGARQFEARRISFLGPPQMDITNLLGPRVRVACCITRAMFAALGITIISSEHSREPPWTRQKSLPCFAHAATCELLVVLFTVSRERARPTPIAAIIMSHES